MATLAVRIAGGGGFNATVGNIQSVRPHKKPGKAVVVLFWSQKHKVKGNKHGVNELVVVGDWKKIKQRWINLKEAQ